MSHSMVGTGMQVSCLVYHGDGYGSCIMCIKCGQFIRPQNFREDCPADEKELEDFQFRYA